MEKQKLLIVDGFAVIFRAFYAFISNPLRTTDGRPTSAIFGFFRMLIKAIKDFKPDYMVIAFESKEPTFRKKLYDEYKANRSEPPEDLTVQIPAIMELTQKFNIPCVSVSGYEADDVIATIASANKGRDDIEVVILSGDKDLMQLVGDNIYCATSTKGVSNLERYDTDAVFNKFGVAPDKIKEYLALVGDSSDNIPGVKGVGAKTAVKFLNEYGSIEGIFNHLDSIKGKMRDNIARSSDILELSLKLVELKTDLDIKTSPESYILPDFNNPDAINMLKDFELESLANDSFFKSSAHAFQKNDAKTKKKEKSAPDVSKTTLLSTNKTAQYQGIRAKEALDDVIRRAKASKYVSFDTETTSTNIIDAKIIGYSLCFDAKNAYYIPLLHDVDTDFNKEYGLKKLKELLEDDSVNIIGQNLKYDYCIIKKEGIDIKNIYFDTMIASYVLDPSRFRHNMDFLAESFLNYKTIKYKEIVDVKKGETLLDVEFDAVASYAAEDADITLRLYNVFLPLLEKDGLTKVFFSVDMPLVRIIGDMELEGVLIDAAYFEKLSADFGKRADTLALSIQSKAGSTFNLNSPQQLAKVLFEDLKLTSKKKTKTGFSTDNQVLEEIVNEHEIIKEIIEYRKLVKLKSTYLDALPPLINEKTGRIHASFNQCVTATGRLSSADPNMQNIPIRGEEGHLIRKGFIPKVNFKMLSADYSQIELRLLAHVTEDETLVSAYKNDDDIHAKTASLIYDVNIKDVTDEMRSNAKTINFAVIYGRGARNLSKDLKISTSEASDFRERYFSSYSGVRDYIEAVKEKSAESGFVKTLFGRIRYLTGYASYNQRDIAQAQRIAFNTIIQGTAADIIKLAMKNITRRLKDEKIKSKLIIQVHDELVFECPDAELEKTQNIVREEMEGVTELKVPLKVNIKWGDNWDEAH